MKSKLTVLLGFILAITTLFVGCKEKEEVNTSNIKKTVLSIMWPDSAFKGPGIQTDPVAMEIEKRIGVSLDVQAGNEDKLRVMMASGELPDILITNIKNSETLITGKLVIPLDPYIENKALKLNDSLISMAYSKTYAGGKDKSLFFLPSNVGSEEVNAMHYRPAQGMFIRWDYYKDLGYPEVNSLDQLLDVLKLMQDKNPTTADGKKVYAFGSWSDWGLWPYSAMFVFPEDSGGYTSEAKSYTESKSGLWRGMEFFNKAYKMGLVDPDGFTMKYDNYLDELKSGKYLTTYAIWMVDEANAALSIGNSKAVGFGHLPSVFPYSRAKLYSNPVGYTDKSLSVTASCKNPDKAVELINYLFSYEGSRLIANGIKGKDWDIVEGKPKLKPEVLNAMNGDKDFIYNRGIGKYDKLQGMADYNVVPDDGAYVKLSLNADTYKSKLSEIDKEFCNYFGVEYPSQIDEKLVEQGKLKFTQPISTSLFLDPKLPDNLNKILITSKDEIIKTIPKLIMADNTMTFKEEKTKTINKLFSMGLGQVVEYLNNRWDEAKIKEEVIRKTATELGN